MIQNQSRSGASASEHEMALSLSLLPAATERSDKKGDEAEIALCLTSETGAPKNACSYAPGIRTVYGGRSGRPMIT